MTRERFIENNVIRNRAELGYARSGCICRSRLSRGFGVVDIALFPSRGAHRLVLVEAKQGTAQDATSKVVGQLLMYYAGALRLGTRGLRLMRRFAKKREKFARRATRKSLKMLAGGISPPEAAERELQKGRKVRPEQIALFVALDGEPSTALKSALKALAQHHKLNIRVVSVLGKNRLQVWRAI